MRLFYFFLALLVPSLCFASYEVQVEVGFDGIDSPAYNVRVVLDCEEVSDSAQSGFTNSNGIIRFSRISPGTCFLVVNPDLSPSMLIPTEYHGFSNARFRTERIELKQLAYPPAPSEETVIQEVKLDPYESFFELSAVIEGTESGLPYGLQGSFIVTDASDPPRVSLVSFQRDGGQVNTRIGIDPTSISPKYQVYFDVKSQGAEIMPASMTIDFTQDSTGRFFEIPVKLADTSVAVSFRKSNGELYSISTGDQATVVCSGFDLDGKQFEIVETFSSSLGAHAFPALAGKFDCESSIVESGGAPLLTNSRMGVIFSKEEVNPLIFNVYPETRRLKVVAVDAITKQAVAAPLDNLVVQTERRLLKEGAPDIVVKSQFMPESSAVLSSLPSTAFIEYPTDQVSAATAELVRGLTYEVAVEPSSDAATLLLSSPFDPIGENAGAEGAGGGLVGGAPGGFGGETLGLTIPPEDDFAPELSALEVYSPEADSKYVFINRKNPVFKFDPSAEVTQLKPMYVRKLDATLAVSINALGTDPNISLVNPSVRAILRVSFTPEFPEDAKTISLEAIHEPAQSTVTEIAVPSNVELTLEVALAREDASSYARPSARQIPAIRPMEDHSEVVELEPLPALLEISGDGERFEHLACTINYLDGSHSFEKIENSRFLELEIKRSLSGVYGLVICFVKRFGENEVEQVRMLLNSDEQLDRYTLVLDEPQVRIPIFSARTIAFPCKAPFTFGNSRQIISMDPSAIEDSSLSEDPVCYVRLESQPAVMATAASMPVVIPTDITFYNDNGVKERPRLVEVTFSSLAEDYQRYGLDIEKVDISAGHIDEATSTVQRIGHDLVKNDSGAVSFNSDDFSAWGVFTEVGEFFHSVLPHNLRCNYAQGPAGSYLASLIFDHPHDGAAPQYLVRVLGTGVSLVSSGPSSAGPTEPPADEPSGEVPVADPPGEPGGGGGGQQSGADDPPQGETPPQVDEGPGDNISDQGNPPTRKEIKRQQRKLKRQRRRAAAKLKTLRTELRACRKSGRSRRQCRRFSQRISKTKAKVQAFKQQLTSLRNSFTAISASVIEEYTFLVDSNQLELQVEGEVLEFQVFVNGHIEGSAMQTCAASSTL